MKKNVSQYISDLHYTHDCVIVPNFGGFVGNRKSAELNKKTGSLSPPSKQILFNRNLTIQKVPNNMGEENFLLFLIWQSLMPY